MMQGGGFRVWGVGFRVLLLLDEFYFTVVGVTKCGELGVRIGKVRDSSVRVHTNERAHVPKHMDRLSTIYFEHPHPADKEFAGSLWVWALGLEGGDG